MLKGWAVPPGFKQYQRNRISTYKQGNISTSDYMNQMIVLCYDFEPDTSDSEVIYYIWNNMNPKLKVALTACRDRKLIKFTSLASQIEEEFENQGSVMLTESNEQQEESKHMRYEKYPKSDRVNRSIWESE